MISVLEFLLFSFYELFTVPLYLRIIWVLCRNKDFQEPFFRMLAIIGICDFVHYVIEVIFYRLPMFGPTVHWFDRSPSRWLTLCAPWAVYFFNHPVYFLQVAISFNRLTNVCFPLRNNAWWKKLWLPQVVAAFFCSFCMTAHRLPFNAITQFKLITESDPTSGYLPFPIKYDYYFIDQSILTIVYNAIMLLLCCAVNGATFAKIMAMKRVGTLAHNEATSSAELNLFVVCVWMMATMLLVIGFQICNFMARDGLFGDANGALYLVLLFQPLVNDLGSMSHAWVLLFMCGSLRRAALPFLGRLSAKIWCLIAKVTKKTVTGDNVPRSLAMNGHQQQPATRHSRQPLAPVQ